MLSYFEDPLFLLSQLLVFLGTVVIFIAFQIKQDKLFRSSFVLAGLLISTHFILLGAYTAAAIGFINTSRWLISIFSKQKYWTWIFIGLFCIALYVTYSSWVSFVVFAAGILGTVAVFQKDQLRVRKIYMGIDVLWIISNIVIFTPIGVVSHILFLGSNVVGYKRLKSTKGETLNQV